MEYAGNVTQRIKNRIMLSLHAYMAGGGCRVNMFLRKANFFGLQRNKFYLTTKFVEKKY